MRLIFLFLLLWSNVAYAKQRVAVLEFRGVGIDSTVLLQVSDDARGGAREGLPTQEFEITSRENIKQILEDMGKDMSACDVECEVTLGRVIGADYVVSGSLMRIEGTYILTIKLHDTLSGSLLGQKKVQEQSTVALFDRTYAVTKALMLEKISSQQQLKLTDLVRTRFDSVPNGEVTVLVGGRPVCSRTPCTKEVPSGSHEVQYLKMEYFPWVETVYLEEGKEVLAELTSTFSTITVNTSPSILENNLQLNGKNQDLKKFKIRPGQHTIMLHDDCYVSEGIEVTIEPGKNEEYTIVPRFKKSAIQVLSFDKNQQVQPGEVYVDGHYLGTTPLQVVVPLCSKTLVVKHMGMKYTEQLKLRHNQVYKLNAVLK